MVGSVPLSSGSKRRASVADLRGRFQVLDLFSHLLALSHFLCNSSQECIWFVFIVVHHMDLVLLGKFDIRLEEFTLLIT